MDIPTPPQAVVALAAFVRDRLNEVSDTLSPLWSWLLGRVRPRRAVPLAFHVFAACCVAFAILVGNDVAPLAISRVFYVWSAVFNLFVVSVFLFMAGSFVVG